MKPTGKSYEKEVTTPKVWEEIDGSHHLVTKEVSEYIRKMEYKENMLSRFYVYLSEQAVINDCYRNDYDVEDYVGKFVKKYNEENTFPCFHGPHVHTFSFYISIYPRFHMSIFKVCIFSCFYIRYFYMLYSPISFQL